MPTSRSHYVRLSSLSLFLSHLITASFYLLTGLKMLFYRHLIFSPPRMFFQPITTLDKRDFVLLHEMWLFCGFPSVSSKMLL